jgi:hypothetical protein
MGNKKIKYGNKEGSHKSKKDSKGRIPIPKENPLYKLVELVSNHKKKEAVSEYHKILIGFLRESFGSQPPSYLWLDNDKCWMKITTEMDEFKKELIVLVNKGRPVLYSFGNFYGDNPNFHNKDKIMIITGAIMNQERFMKLGQFTSKKCISELEGTDEFLDADEVFSVSHLK